MGIEKRLDALARALLRERQLDQEIQTLMQQFRADDVARILRTIAAQSDDRLKKGRKTVH